MQLFFILCSIAGAFATQDCPANSHYNSCGTACPLTCENYLDPPEACVKMCNPGCHCDEGFVKNHDGQCVRTKDCKTHVVCGENQEFTTCGTACPLTCDNYKNPPKICNLMCMIGCQCKEGYVKTRDGQCVRPESCPSGAVAPIDFFRFVGPCLMKPDPGMCKGSFPMYYYDAKTGKCEEFIYGGCKGNSNRFQTIEECLGSCSSVRVSADAKSDVCDQPIEIGPCMALFHRYAYDKETGTCRKFVYGGCGGNKNNFVSLEECNDTCAE